MDAASGRAERLRHRRKYAEGDMRYHSFYFRGAKGRQNLKAQNLIVFSQIADGIDEETWLFHLYRGDYSRWFREAVKDKHRGLNNFPILLVGGRSDDVIP
jgi:hypothetical protein